MSMKGAQASCSWSLLFDKSELFDSVECFVVLRVVIVLEEVLFLDARRISCLAAVSCLVEEHGFLFVFRFDDSIPLAFLIFVH